MADIVKIWHNVDEARNIVLRREAVDEVAVSPAMAERLQAIFGRPITPAEAVAQIVADVRAGGDAALLQWMERIDGQRPLSLEVQASEKQNALHQVSPPLQEALRLAAQRIDSFHRRQHIGSWTHFDAEGALGQIVRPLERVGIYVPAGSAPLPSSLLMAAIPARVAGVAEIIVTTPPDRQSGRVSPAILAAAEIAGVDRVFAVGGAQAIAALAYGTESIPRVDKIVGPGGLFVVLAKRLVFGSVAIDGIPGPTETLIIADENARPKIVAADMLAQAEHDPLAAAILLTPSVSLAERVKRELETQTSTLARRSIIEESLGRRSGIIIVRDLEEAIDLANEYAPEHLCLLVSRPWEWIGHIRHAGGIFVGEASFEVLGDYVAGPSHIMPTNGTARFASPVSIADFVKITSLVALNPLTLKELGPAAIAIAEAEGLTAHAAAVHARDDSNIDQITE